MVLYYHPAGVSNRDSLFLVYRGETSLEKTPYFQRIYKKLPFLGHFKPFLQTKFLEICATLEKTQVLKLIETPASSPKRSYRAELGPSKTWFHYLPNE